MSLRFVHQEFLCLFRKQSFNSNIKIFLLLLYTYPFSISVLTGYCKHDVRWWKNIVSTLEIARGPFYTISALEIPFYLQELQ